MKPILASLVLLALTAGPAFADESPGSAAELVERADTHLRRGVEFYAEKQYELAIIEFRAGYGIDPRPEFLFALAQAERLSGDCASAVVYYQRFLDTGPDANQTEAARINMRRCTRALESAPRQSRPRADARTLAEAEEASEPAPPVTPPMTAVPSAPAPWYRDPVGMGLLGGGVVSLVASGLFLDAKAGAEADARDADDYGAYVAHIERARSRRNLALVTGGIGAALLTGAIIRYVTRDDGDERHSTTVVAVPAEGGGIVGLSGSF